MIDLNNDGIIQPNEVRETMGGLTVDLESLIMELVNQTKIETTNMNFADFLIYTVQRRNRDGLKQNPIRELFNVKFIITNPKILPFLRRFLLFSCLVPLAV